MFLIRGQSVNDSDMHFQTENGGDAVVSAASRQEAAPSSGGSSWYQEVMELRKRADEYKRRARGTHFSREHLAQLYARQAELWDNVSTSTTLSALSLESAAAQEHL